MLFPSPLLRHQSVSGAPPPKKNPGSAPAPDDNLGELAYNYMQ